jgi:hypothetical protein
LVLIDNCLKEGDLNESFRNGFSLVFEKGLKQPLLLLLKGQWNKARLEL